MIISFGGDNFKCFFLIEKSNYTTICELNKVLKNVLNPEKDDIKKEIESIIFEEIEIIKWESFISEIRYWFNQNKPNKLKFIKHTFSNGRNHYAGQFTISKKDFSFLLKFIEKIDVVEINQFWLHESQH